MNCGPQGPKVHRIIDYYRWGLIQARAVAYPCVTLMRDSLNYVLGQVTALKISPLWNEKVKSLWK